MQKDLVRAAQRAEGLLDGGMEGEARVVPSPDSPYAALGEVEPVSLISFAYQIASGMVCLEFAHNPVFHTISQHNQSPFMKVILRFCAQG